MTDKLEAMRIFVEVARSQSFVRASQKLNLSAPKVTRAIAGLEDLLNSRLLSRSTRHVRLTDAGQKYLLDVTRILEDVQQAEANISGNILEPSGTLSITAPVMFGHKHIAPIIADYLIAHPSMSVNASFHDRVVNILEEDLDLAVRIGNMKDSGLFALNVGYVKKVLCASPEYLEKYGAPKDLTELSEHMIIQSTAVDRSNHWKFVSDKGTYSVKLKPRLSCNQNAAAVAAAIKGAGITRLVSYQVGDELQQGKLQTILQEYETQLTPVNLVYLEGRRASAKIRSFLNFAQQQLTRTPVLQH